MQIICFHDPDEVHTKLTGDMGKDYMSVSDINVEHGVGQ